MKYDRLRDMGEYIAQRDFVSLDELCRVFDRSKNTVRRDVAELAAGGAVEKVYGGVRPMRVSTDALLTFNERTVKHAAAKQRIGAAAAALVADDDIIFLDSGTTTLQLAAHLAPVKNLTIVTNNLHVINRCMDLPGTGVITIGGQLNKKTASFATNFFTLENLKSLNITKAFMAATGVSLEGGVTNTSPEELAIKRTIVEKCDNCVLLADHSKFGHTALLTYARLDTFRHVVTDQQPAPAYCEFFAQHGITVRVS